MVYSECIININNSNTYNNNNNNTKLANIQDFDTGLCNNCWS